MDLGLWLGLGLVSARRRRCHGRIAHTQPVKMIPKRKGRSRKLLYSTNQDNYVVREYLNAKNTCPIFFFFFFFCHKTRQTSMQFRRRDDDVSYSTHGLECTKRGHLASQRVQLPTWVNYSMCSIRILKRLMALKIRQRQKPRTQLYPWLIMIHDDQITTKKSRTWVYFTVPGLDRSWLCLYQIWVHQSWCLWSLWSLWS